VNAALIHRRCDAVASRFETAARFDSRFEAAAQDEEWLLSVRNKF
jgi:hypothetical protein